MICLITQNIYGGINKIIMKKYLFLFITLAVVIIGFGIFFRFSANQMNKITTMTFRHSWGGFAVCTVLNYNHNVNAAVSFAGFNIAQELFKEEGVSITGGLFYILIPQFWAIEKQLFGGAANLTAVGGINKSNIPVMIVQSSDDEVIKADTTSIYAHRNKITNPHVDIVFFDGDNVTGHEYVFRSKAMEEYREIAQSNYEEYQVANQIEKATNADLANWARGYGFDKFKANELNPELMERINDLFNNVK